MLQALTEGPTGAHPGTMRVGVRTDAHPPARPQAHTKLCVCERLLCTRPSGSGPPYLLLRKPVHPTRGHAPGRRAHSARARAPLHSRRRTGLCVWEQVVLASP